MFEGIKTYKMFFLFKEFTVINILYYTLLLRTLVSFVKANHLKIITKVK